MARLRSPNFPVTTLEDAVKAAEAIYDKNRRAVIMREDAAKDIGYTGLTGRSMQVLGSLVQYDLLENTSKGECRITKTAEDILHGIPDDKKKDALRRAGHAPALFQSVFDRFEGEIPGENAVRSFLIQNGFTNDGASKALKNFLATNRYLEMHGVTSNAEQTIDEREEANSQTVDLSESPVRAAQTTTSAEQFDNHVGNPWSGGELDFNLSSNGLAVTGRTNSQRDLKAFIAKLQALAPLLPNGESTFSD